LTKKLPDKPKHLTVLDYYGHVVNSLLSYRSPEFFILSADNARATKVKDELQKLGRECTIVELSDKDVDVDVFPNLVRKSFESNVKEFSEKPPFEANSENVDVQEKTFLNLEENTLREIVDGVMRWIGSFQNEGNPSHMPKTRPKLENAIRRLCSYRYGADTNTVLNLLFEENLIQLCEICGAVFYPKKNDELKTTFPKPLASNSSYSVTSENSKNVLALVLEKVKEWLFTQKLLPSTLDPLRNQINSIKIVHSLEPSRIVQHLIDNRIVNMTEEEKSKNDHPSSSYTYQQSENISYMKI